MLRKIVKDKKGQLFTFLPYLIFGIVLVFIFAVISLVVSIANDEILDELKKPENFGSNNDSVTSINQIQDLTTPVFDQMVFVTLIAVILAAIIIAIFTDYHPVVLGVFIIVIALLVIITGLLVNAFDDIRDNPVLSDKSEEFVLTNTLFDSPLPIIIIFIGVLGVIILLSKRGRVGGA